MLEGRIIILKHKSTLKCTLQGETLQDATMWHQMHAQFFKVQISRHKGLATHIPTETPAELRLPGGVCDLWPYDSDHIKHNERQRFLCRFKCQPQRAGIANSSLKLWFSGGKRGREAKLCNRWYCINNLHDGRR